MTNSLEYLNSKHLNNPSSSLTFSPPCPSLFKVPISPFFDPLTTIAVQHDADTSNLHKIDFLYPFLLTEVQSSCVPERVQPLRSETMRLSWSSQFSKHKNHRHHLTSSVSELYSSMPTMAQSYPQATPVNFPETTAHSQVPRTPSNAVSLRSLRERTCLKTVSMRFFQKTQRSIQQWSHAT